MKNESCLLGLALWVLAFGAAEAQVTSAQLSEVLFQERFGLGNGPVGEENLDYLALYDADDQQTTGLSHHAGIDFRARTPETVYSPVFGRVTNACDDIQALENLGALAIFVDDPSIVTVRDEETISGYTVIFLHLSSCEVAFGDTVHPGDKIALTGSAGGVPPHLHIEVQRGDDPIPCGTTGNGVDLGCPGNEEDPTHQDVISDNTYDPREVIKSIVSARDLDGQLDAAKLSDGLHFTGLNFGDEGSLLVTADMSQSEESEEYEACAGSSMLIWEVEAADLENWSNTEVAGDLFPRNETLCEMEFVIVPEEIRAPLSFKILRSNGAETNAFSFPFKDVEAGAWYAPHVVQAWTKGVIEGYKKLYPREGIVKSENRFSPESDVTIGEALKMVFVASGLQLPASPSCACEGIDALHWAYPYVCDGLNRGWLTCPLGPDESATRGFVAAIIARSLEMPEDQAVEGDLFDDVSETHAYAREITFCQRMNIFMGYDDGTFKPDAEINRAELAKTLNIGFLGGQP